MSLWETLITALTDIGRHKFRSILAALGIIFGVASVEASFRISATTAVSNRDPTRGCPPSVLGVEICCRLQARPVSEM